MKVFKFGGASIKDAQGVKNVASIIQSQMGTPLLIVVSAMGKTTNKLEELVDAFFYQKAEKETLFQNVKNEHLSLVNDLFDGNPAISADIENLFETLYAYIQEDASENYDFEYDQIVSYGELTSTKIVAHYLNTLGLAAHWIDVRTLIRTDNTYREGVVNWEKTQRKIKKHIEPIYTSDSTQLVVTQGFIGGTSEGLTTTLGREGSDFSAAILGFSLEAESVTIWKDVEGLLNADPRLFPDTIKLNKISYREAIELAYYGASIIHPKTLKPLQNKKIPLYVKSFIQPQEEGSVIGDFSIKRLVPCYICKKNQVLISLSPKDFSFIAEENLSTIFGLFAFFGVKINLTQNSALSFSLCVDYNANIHHLIEELQTEFFVKYNFDMTLFTIRHYTQQSIQKVIQNKTVVLEQKNRSTVQYVIKESL
jgi:aspartate kinase